MTVETEAWAPGFLAWVSPSFGDVSSLPSTLGRADRSPDPSGEAQFAQGSRRIQGEGSVTYRVRRGHGADQLARDDLMEGVHRGGSTFSFALLIPWIVRYRVFVFAYPFLSFVRKVQGLGPLTCFVCCIYFFSALGWSIFFVASDRLLLLGITYFSPHAHTSSTWVSLSSRPCSSWRPRARPLPRAPTVHSSRLEPKMGPSRSTHLDIRAKS